MNLDTMQKAVKDYCNVHGCIKCIARNECAKIERNQGESIISYKKRFYTTLYAVIKKK